MVRVTSMIMQGLLMAGLTLLATKTEAESLFTLRRITSAPSNPYEGKQQYVNPRFVKHVDSSIAKVPGKADVLRKVQILPVAVWLDNIAATTQIRSYLEEARRQQNNAGKPVVVTFVIYDLPNRDCAAAASNGELLVAQNGLARYKAEYIDVIAREFAAYPDISIAGIVEPDSLPNLVTNLATPKCAEASQAYRDGVVYTLQKLSALPHVTLYLDAAHEGWLGWPDNRSAFARLVADLLQRAGGPQVIRGFATNVANYNSISTFTNGQPAYPIDFNPAWNETSYVQLLKESMDAAGMPNMRFIVDTSRQRVLPVENKKLQEWCNIKGAGLGLRPTTNPHPLMDAYVWVKIPGESDGTSDKNAARFDFHCASADSYQPSPEAGEWNHEYFMGLVERATPPL